MVSFRTAAVASAAVALLVPAAAQAKTKEMYVGPPAATAKKLGQTTTANAFFPSKLTVNVGDSVSFVPAGFHTVNLPEEGRRPARLFVPTGQKVAGSTDAAGAAVLVQRAGRAGPEPARSRPPALRQEVHLHRRQDGRVGPAAARSPSR